MYVLALDVFGPRHRARIVAGSDRARRRSRGRLPASVERDSNGDRLIPNRFFGLGLTA